MVMFNSYVSLPEGIVCYGVVSLSCPAMSMTCSGKLACECFSATMMPPCRLRLHIAGVSFPQILVASCYILLHLVASCCILLHLVASCCILFLVASCCILLHLVASCCILLHLVASCCILLHLVASLLVIGRARVSFHVC